VHVVFVIVFWYLSWWISLYSSFCDSFRWVNSLVKQYESWESVYALSQSLRAQHVLGAKSHARQSPSPSGKGKQPKQAVNTNAASSTNANANKPREEILATLEKLIASLVCQLHFFFFTLEMCDGAYWICVFMFCSVLFLFLSMTLLAGCAG
jgi:hypothetical protein